VLAANGLIHHIDCLFLDEDYPIADANDIGTLFPTIDGTDSLTLGPTATSSDSMTMVADSTELPTAATTDLFTSFPELTEVPTVTATLDDESESPAFTISPSSTGTVLAGEGDEAVSGGTAVYSSLWTNIIVATTACIIHWALLV
jgi:hypothetical protein